MVSPTAGIESFATESSSMRWKMAITPDTILKSYLDAGIDVERFELSQPSLSDILGQEVARARAVP